MLKFMVFVRIASGLLNVRPNQVSDLVLHMQDRIFVESRLLSSEPTPNDSKICDSLSGPRCTLDVLREKPSVSGVLPAGFVDSSTPFSVSFDEVAMGMDSEVWKFNLKAALSALPSSPSVVYKNEGGLSARGKPGALPAGVTWEGGSALPGYMRFGKPVLIKRLWVEVTGKRALVILRRKGRPVWSSTVLSRLDDLKPVTVDVCENGSSNHAPLESADEIVFLSNRGVKVVAIELYEASDVLLPVMLLTKTDSGLLLQSALVDAILISSGSLVSVTDALRAGRSLKHSENLEIHSHILNLSLFARGLVPLPVEVTLNLSRNTSLPKDLRRALNAVTDEEIDSLSKLLVTRSVQKAVGGLMNAKAHGESHQHELKKGQVDERKLRKVEDLLLTVLLHI